MERSQVFNNNEGGKDYSKIESRSFIGKVFLYLFLGLLLSAVVAFVGSYAFYYGFAHGTEEEQGVYFTICLTVLAIAGIALLINSIVISVKQWKMKNIILPYITYSILMGIVLSALVVFVNDPNIIGSALAITSVMFGVMCLFGFLFKGRIGWILGLMVGLVVSALLLLVVNLFLFPFAFHVQSAFDSYCTIYWVIEGILLLVMMISTFIDMYRIRKISDAGSNSSNLALYCALTLYSDFIVILLRVIYILLYMSNRKD